MAFLFPGFLSILIFAVMSSYLKIGKLVSAHGVAGELILQHELGKKTALKGLQAVFIEDKKGSFIPWFIKTTRPKTTEELYIQLEEINTREAALKLVQKPVWIPEAEFKKYAAKSSVLTLLGYTVIDQGKDLGEILEVIEQPQQLICRLEIGGKEVLVPLHEEFLETIDHKKKQVLVHLPNGLLDIYLS